MTDAVNDRQEEDDLSAGFSAVRAQAPADAQPEKKADVATEPTGDAKPDAQAPANAPPATEGAPQVVDPWDGVKPELRALLEPRLAGVDKLDVRLKNAEQRIGALQRDLKSAGTAARAEVKDAPTTSQIAAAVKVPEKWAAMKQDFPEWADAMEERLAAERAAIPQAQPVDVDGLSARLQSQVAGDVETRIAEIRVDIVESRHPGWEDTVKEPEFSEWLRTQPEERQQLASSSRPKDAIKLLDAYAARAKPATKPDNKQRLEAAIPVQGTGNAPPAASLNDEEAELSAGYRQVRRVR